MTISFVFHRVEDYDAWRTVYDSVAGLQREGGVTSETVYRGQSDANEVLVMHRFADADQAHAFFEQSELREAMINAGVDAGSMRLEFYDEA